jgi:site-specific DNA-adenine methylase
MTLRAPFPRFGGKSGVAADVWTAFGRVQNYVEPFFGTGAVLLARPDFDGTQTETVNDADCYLANFWRAVQADPDAVADACDWPVNEADLHARHAWLLQRSGLREKMADPAFFDAKAAGWWVWGAGLWIGSGWCEGSLHRKLPELGSSRGIHRVDLGYASVRDYLRAIADRLRHVRVACGDWSRVTGDSVTWRHGLTAVFLDPPYAEGASDLYSEHDKSLSAKVREWAIANGDNPKMRIALCGYEGEHTMPPTWRTHEWKARGGYGSQREDGDNENAKRERVWFSPYCLGGTMELPLFAGVTR